jgi:SEC-C motif-containing protein
MRSRYSAYALKLPKYIQKTTHPKSPYFEKELSKWLAGIEEFCKTTEFVRLEILGHGPTHVYFAAHLKQQGRPFTLTEKSRFEQIGSSWRYLDGEIFKT